MQKAQVDRDTKLLIKQMAYWAKRIKEDRIGEQRRPNREKTDLV